MSSFKDKSILIVWKNTSFLQKFAELTADAGFVSVMHLNKFVERKGDVDLELDEVIIQMSSKEFKFVSDEGALATLVKRVSSGGCFAFHISGMQSSSLTDGFRTAILSAGLTFQSKGLNDDILSVICLKPTWKSGATATLSSRRKKKSKATNAPSKVWKMLASDIAVDTPLVDEDALLDEDALTLPSKKPAGCGTEEKTNKARKPCKNCTCGLKDAEGKKTVSDAEMKEMKSSCGNCHKGDAFRCGSCPFLGKPAFNKGDTVKISL
eukprot:g3322.t1